MLMKTTGVAGEKAAAANKATDQRLYISVSQPRHSRLYDFITKQNNSCNMEKVFTIKTVPQSVHDDYMSGKITLLEAARIMCKHGYTAYVSEERTKWFIDEYEKYETKKTY